MHAEFPCKFFHTGVVCYHADACRFSHAPMDERAERCLKNHLNKESREGRNFAAGGYHNSSGSTASPPRSSRHFGDDSFGFDLEDHSDGKFFMIIYLQYFNFFFFLTEPFMPGLNRMAVLGPVPDRLKYSYRAWRWQQEIAELRSGYQGKNRDIFSIDHDFVIKDKPEASDDEADQEAMIDYYYGGKNADIDEIICSREIEEHRRSQMKVDDEERIMVNASKHDVDLRKRVRGQGYIIPSVFGIDMSFLNYLPEISTLPEIQQFAPSSMSLGPYNHPQIGGPPSFGPPGMPSNTQNFFPQSQQPTPVPPNIHSSPQEPIFRDPRFMKDHWPAAIGPDNRNSPMDSRPINHNSRNFGSDPRRDGPPEHMQFDPRLQDPRSDLRGDPRADLRGDPRSDLRVDPRSDLRGDPRSELRGDPRSDLRGDPRSDLRGDPRSDLRVDPRSDLRGDPRFDPRPDIRNELRQDPRSELSIDPRVNSRSDVQLDPRMDPRTDIRLDPRVEPRPDFRSDPRSDIRGDPRYQPDPRSMSVIDPRQSNSSSTFTTEPSPIPPSLVADPRLNKSDPRLAEAQIDDPRVNRSLKPLESVMKSQTSLDESSFYKKSFVKAYPQTLATYHIRPTITSRIDYRSYEDLFRSDILPKDPRLQNFFEPISSPEKAKEPEIKKEQKKPQAKITEILSDALKKSQKVLNEIDVEGSTKLLSKSLLKSNPIDIETPTPPTDEVTTSLASPPAPSTPEKVPNSPIFSQPPSSTASTLSSPTVSKPVTADIPLYARVLFTQNVATPNFDALASLMSVSATAPTISRQLSVSFINTCSFIINCFF